MERYLHLAIEEIIDTANPIVSFHQWREPAGYRDLMRILSEKEFHFRPRRPAGYLAWVVYRKPRKPLAFYQFGERAHIIKHLDRLIARGEVPHTGKFLSGFSCDLNPPPLVEDLKKVLPLRREIK